MSAMSHHLADVLLAPAFGASVNRGSVNVVHTHVERPLDDRYGGVEVAGLLQRSLPAQREDAHLVARLAQVARRHGLHGHWIRRQRRQSLVGRAPRRQVLVAGVVRCDSKRRGCKQRRGRYPAHFEEFAPTVPALVQLLVHRFLPCTGSGLDQDRIEPLIIAPRRRGMETNPPWNRDLVLEFRYFPKEAGCSIPTSLMWPLGLCSCSFS